MWIYRQSSGCIIDPSGVIIGTGYSGHGAGLNNPALQASHGVGPIPQGKYHIGSLEAQHAALGLNVAGLFPHDDNEMFGRSGFFMHGDNASRNRTGSEGCIVLDHDLRMQVLQSEDRELLVAA